MSDFYRYFKENMDGLGLPAPESLYGNLQMAVANAAIFVGHIDKYGKAITVPDLIGAGTRLEKLGVVAALSASFYVGAVIGSSQVAPALGMMMRDQLLLILVAAAFAVGAWAFWHYLGQDAFTTLSILALVSVTADNLRLRRKLRDMNSSG